MPKTKRSSSSIENVDLIAQPKHEKNSTGTREKKENTERNILLDVLFKPHLHQNLYESLSLLVVFMRICGSTFLLKSSGPRLARCGGKKNCAYGSNVNTFSTRGCRWCNRRLCPEKGRKEIPKLEGLLRLNMSYGRWWTVSNRL